MNNREFPSSNAESASFKPSGKARYEEVLMKEAHENIEKGEYQNAANIFDDILRRFGVSLDPDQKSLINSETAMLYFWLGDYETAKRHAEESLSFGDNDHAFEILGKIAVAQFRFPLARSYFSKISSENPAKALGLCLVSIKLRDTIGAQSFLQDAAGKKSPNDPEFRVFAAYVRLLKGGTDDAVSEARGLLRLPRLERDPFLTLLLAEILMTAGNYGEAAAVAKRVGKSAPESDHVFALLAHTNYSEENFAKADSNAREAVRLNPHNAYAKTVLMKLAIRNGSYEVAESIGTDILRDCPEYSLGHANLGDVYFNQGRFELAEVEYEQTMQLMDSDTKGARLRKARMEFIKGDYAAAAEKLERLAESQHTYYDDAMCDLLLCYGKMNEPEKRARLIEKMQMRKYFYHRMEKLLQAISKS